MADSRWQMAIRDTRYAICETLRAIRLPRRPAHFALERFADRLPQGFLWQNIGHGRQQSKTPGDHHIAEGDGEVRVVPRAAHQ